MSSKVGQASRLPPSATPTERTGRAGALGGRLEACPTLNRRGEGGRGDPARNGFARFFI